MANRICTSIVSDPELRLKRLEELKTYRIKQHFPENLIYAGVNKSFNISRMDLRKRKLKEDQNLEDIPFVVTHNPRNHNILRSAKRFLPILEQSSNPLTSTKSKETFLRQLQLDLRMIENV